MPIGRHRFITPLLLTIIFGALLIACSAANHSLAQDQPEDAAASAAPTQAGPLVDLRRSGQSVSGENFLLELHLSDALAKDQGASDVVITIPYFDSAWHPGHASARQYNTAKHSCEAKQGSIQGNRIQADLQLTLKPDRWVPADKKPRDMHVSVDLTFGPLHDSDKTGNETDFTTGRFWTVFPSSQGSFRAVKGSFNATFEGRNASGQVVGRMTKPLSPGQWNMGEWVDKAGGVRFDFALGTKRQNWNHARLAQLALPQTTDLTNCKGLALTVTTDNPRHDAEVSVWLREEDGSWYYLKSALPLVQQTNQATILFRDFAEAEWVAPTNHMDEDYVLDLTAISHVAIGVVNPFGIGDVGFVLTQLDVVPGQPYQPTLASVSVTGRTLAINDHDVLPAPVIGGYAGHLAQKYRPGCQRHLYAPSYPIIPRQKFVEFRTSSFHNWQNMLAIVKGEVEQHKAFAEHLVGLVDDERTLTDLNRFNLDRHLKGRNPERAPGALTNVLDRALRKPELYKADFWKGITLDDQVKQRLEALRQDKLNDTELMELNRWLLELRFPGQIQPVPRHGPTEQYYINCLGERKQPAFLLTNSNWKDYLKGFGTRLAHNARKAGYVSRFEFWNEPYLNWAERSRVNLNSKYFINENGKVRVRYGNGELGPVIPHFKWEGDKVVDETAFSYWSGRGNGWIYDEMLGVIGPAIKKHNPDIQVIAGWGFRWNEDHWAAWDMLYKPTIDRNIDWIDGLHEHHYQGDTTAMNGSYEVAVAYGVTEHDKWLYCYNTETNDLVDAPARGGIDTPEKARAATQYRRMTYNLRDILYCFYESPDKFIARTVIHNEATPDATRICFGMLSNLRGRMIETQSSDTSVWCVASVDGTDPQAMDPEYDGIQQLVVFVFNDHRRPQEVDFTVEPPTGTTFAGPALIERNTVDKSTYAIDLKQQPAKVDAKQANFRFTLPDRGAWKVTLPLNGKITDKHQVARKQFFSSDLLKKVTHDQSFETTVKLDPQLLKKAHRAWLRIVVEDIAPGEAVARVGTQTITLPKAWTADNVNRIFNLPVDLEALSPETTIRFAVTSNEHAGYRVDMTSLVLESR